MIKDIQERIIQSWRKFTNKQKIVLGASSLVLLLMSGGVIYWASQPQYVPIFTKQSEADAGAITAKLKELKINYQLQDGGTTIAVTSQNASEVRLELANAGLPQTSKFSFDYLNTTRLGETDADRKLRYALGLQNELETTLKTLKGVSDARVHIVTPEQSIFTDNKKEPTAAVTLSLTPGTTLKEEQIQSIANLVSSSVEGLKPVNVSIMDTTGKTLSDNSESSVPAVTGMSNKQLQLQQTVETNLQKSVQTMLDGALGSGKSIVRVNAVLNFDQTKVTETTNNNPSNTLISSQSTAESTISGGTTGDVPGPSTNVPGQGITYPAGTMASSSGAKNSLTENFAVDTRHEETVSAPGSIKRLSVSVLMDSGSLDASQVQEMQTQIQTIVGSAAGIDTKRGDQLQIAAVAFDKTSALAEQQALADAAKKAQTTQYMLYALAGVAGLFFVFFFLKKRKKQNQTTEMMETKKGKVSLGDLSLRTVDDLLTEQERAENEAKLKLAERNIKSPDDIAKQKTRESIEEYVRNNPEDMARLLKNWIAEE